MDFRDSIARVRQENLTYISTARLQLLTSQLIETLAAGVAGQVLEFGIALGGSGTLLAKGAVAHQRHFHGFDVFAMIPPPTSEKDDENSKRRYNQIKSGKSKGIGGEKYYGYRDNLFDEVTETFTRHGIPVDGETVIFHKGLFEETWPSYQDGPVAFAHIDCDWYDPVAFCLRAVADLMPSGGTIILDDYDAYGGCRTATLEFLEQRQDFAQGEGEQARILRKL